MDQQARTGMPDAVEIVEGSDSGHLAILAAGDADGDGGMLAKQVVEDRRDGDRR